MFETLYKRTSTGKIQQWQIETQGNKFRTISGQTTGKKTTSEWTECFGKNTGKANETTNEEQALLEATAKFDKQLDKHYFKNIKAVDEVKFVKAMLAKKYEDVFKGDFNNLYSQPKLDGCVAGDTVIETEKGLRKIKDVATSDDKFVLSFNTTTNKKEMKNINGRFMNAVDIRVNGDLKWMKFTLSNGNVITVTDNHRFYLPDLNIWRMAKDIKEGDNFLITT